MLRGMIFDTNEEVIADSEAYFETNQNVLECIKMNVSLINDIIFINYMQF